MDTSDKSEKEMEGNENEMEENKQEDMEESEQEEMDVDYVEMDDQAPSTSKSKTERYYQCDHCDSIFSTASNMKRHERTIHQGDKYLCHQCGGTSDRKSNHKCMSWKCQSCNQLFITRDALQQHDCAQTQCETCGKILQNAKALARHSVACKRKRCDLCDAPVISSMKVHKDQCPELQCHKCEKRFNRKGPRDNHIEKCNGKKCPHCDGNYIKMGDHRPNCPGLTCKHCKKTFDRKISMEKHLTICVKNKNKEKKCRFCKKEFKRPAELIRHLKICGPFKCDTCDKLCNSADALTTHKETHLKRQSDQPSTSRGRKRRRIVIEYHCRTEGCNKIFKTKPALQKHKLDLHLDPDRVQMWPEPYPWKISENEISEKMREVLTDNRHYVFQNHVHNDTHSNYNFPMLDTEWHSDLRKGLETVRKANSDAVKVNVSMGYLLQHKEDGKYRYFAAGENFPLFARPIRIDRFADWDKVFTESEMETVTDNVDLVRPDTKWELRMVTNANIEVSYLNVNMGGGDIPHYVKKNPCIISLDNDSHGFPFQDRKCAMRALAFHDLSQNDPKNRDPPNRVADTDLRARTLQYAEEWGQDGLDLDNVHTFEEFFNIDVDIFSLQPDESVIPMYMTEGKRGANRITLNLHDEHLSYVSYVKGYLIKYQCSSCLRQFEQVSDLKRHRGICTRASLRTFNFDHYKPSQTIFDRLECEGIHVALGNRCYKWFATFDCEASLMDTEPTDDNTRWVKEHRLISMSVASNVGDLREPVCFMGKDPEKIVLKAVQYLNKIVKRAGEYAIENWRFTIAALENMIDLASEQEMDIAPADDSEIFSEEEENEEGEEEVVEKEIVQVANGAVDRLVKLKDSFINYCKTVPILGFNSGNYDMNLIKAHLFPAIGITSKSKPSTSTEKTEPEPTRSSPRKCKPAPSEFTGLPIDTKSYVIKKNNSYTAIVANNMRFLDVMNFQAAGTSYSLFLKAHMVKDSKSVIPYEWIKNADCLDYPRLPDYDDFYSTLKGRHLLEEEGDRAKGLERWNCLKKLWKEKGWTRFADYLAYYNNLDVGPFVDAVEKMQEFYFPRGIDVLKSAVSIPGISRLMLFETARQEKVSFASILQDDEDLFYILKRGIVGGPSIIFRRKHTKDGTYLYDDEGNPCYIIVGYDANALYLWALDQAMPCGGYVRRFGPDFKPVPRLYRQDMFDWMDFIALTEKRHIRHGRNRGEVRILGKYKVDGFCQETQTAYEFDGCYFHGCKVCYAEGKSSEHMNELREKTVKRRAFIEKALETKVVVITECEYKNKLKLSKNKLRATEEEVSKDPSKTNLFDFTESRLPPLYKQYRYAGMPANRILDHVKSGLLYGMVEVDIEVPDGKYEQFAEMSPLFSTIDIPFEDIGEHMQSYVKKEGFSEKPRRLLVGGMKAEKLLVHTDLLKWYLNHGLEVTNVHQVVEFRPQRCFRPFVNLVTEARRQSDTNPDLKPEGDRCKVIGNAAYGSLIMDKFKHQNTRYVQTRTQAQQLVNDPRFKSISDITPELKEVTMSKSRVLCDLPIQLGFTILQLAKLRMLEFYYDFLQSKCEKGKYEMCEMDTDSAYMALSEPDIPSIVKQEHKKEFNDSLQNNHHDLPHGPDEGHFFPRECCPKHNKFDQRTPGLFKLEASGVEMVSLCSKTYSLLTEDGKVKFSSKGLNKRSLVEPHEMYKRVLSTGKAEGATNIGFRPHKGTIYTYEQERKSISYFYCKRQVMDDGIRTRPLPTILKIWPDRKLDIVSDESHPLWPGKIHNFDLDGEVYPTLVDVCIKAMDQDEPEKLVERALSTLEPYEPVGDLFFVAKDEFHKRYYQETHCYYWTSGMTELALPRLSPDQYPGINKLADIIIKINQRKNNEVA